MTHTHTLIQTQTQLVQWFIHRHQQKWCTQRHRHRDTHRLKASLSSWWTSHSTGGTHCPLAASRSLSLQRWPFFLFPLPLCFLRQLLPTYLCFVWWVQGNVYKNILKESRRYTICLCEPSTLIYWSTLWRKPKPRVVCKEKINGLVEDILVVNSFCRSEQIIDNVCA